MHKKLPPACKAHTHSDPMLTVWALLEREGLLDRAYTEAWLWYALPPKLRHRYERERQMLQAAYIAGYTPPRIYRRTQPDPWLYLTTMRGTYYRLHSDGTIQIWKRNPPQPGIGGGGWGWYPTSSRGNRWLWAISSALFLRHIREESAAEGTTEQAAPAEPAAAPAPVPSYEHSTVSMVYTQLLLFD